MSNPYTQDALDLLDDYFLFRTTYAKQLKLGYVPPKVQEEYLKVEQQILELMGAEE